MIQQHNDQIAAKTDEKEKVQQDQNSKVDLQQQSAAQGGNEAQVAEQMILQSRKATDYNCKQIIRNARNLTSFIKLGAAAFEIEMESLGSKKTQRQKREKRFHCMDPLCKYMMVAKAEHWEVHRRNLHPQSDLKSECIKKNGECTLCDRYDKL